MMARRIYQTLFFSSMFGCLFWLTVISVVHADGRVFLLDQRNISDSVGLAKAEHACAIHDARLASSEELRHAVVECSFSACTRGWLDGGSVGTTECSNVGSALKAVDVKIENATEDNTYLDVFCVKDKGVPCGDPPAFPNTRLQGHTGFEMGDELLYSCLPGHVMPSGHSAFSLLCDSCGEWYGLVQLCGKHKTEAHIDYEDKFTDDDHHLSYDTPAEEEGHEEEPLEEEVHEEEGHEEEGHEEQPLEEEGHEEEGYEEQPLEEEGHEEEGHEEQPLEEEGHEEEGHEEEGHEEQPLEEEGHEEEEHEEQLLEEEEDTEKEEHRDPKQQEARFSLEGVEEAGGKEEAGGEEEVQGGEELSVGEEEVGGGEEEEVEDLTDHPVEEEEQVEEMGVSEVTEAPVSLLSQKHLFWFPSEAFQEVGHVEPTHPTVTQDTPTQGDNRVRASSSESEESKQDDSQPEEMKDYDSHEGHFQQPIDPDNHDDHEDDVNHEHDDQPEQNHYSHDNQTDPDHNESSEQVLEGEDHVVEHLAHNDHDDHESHGSEDAHREAQGEHEEDHHEKAGRYDDDDVGEEHYDMGEHEEDHRNRAHYHSHGVHDDHEDHEGNDRDDVTDLDDHDHSDPSDHHDDQDHVHVYDHLDEDQSEHEDDRSDVNRHNHDHDDHHHDDQDHNDHDDHVVHPVSMTTGKPQNVTQERVGGKPTASTDKTWLDGYPVSQEETDTDKVGGGSTEEGVEPEVGEEEEEGVVVVGATDRPNEVELTRPTLFTGVPQVSLSTTQGANPVEQDQDQGWVGGLTPTASHDSPLSPEATASDSHSADYAAPSLTSSLDDNVPGNAARPSPMDSWETTDHVHPFREHGPAPTVSTYDVIDEEKRSAEHNLTRHSGEMEVEEGESEGETRETGCMGGEEDCPPPPPPSSGRGSAVAVIVVTVCAVAVAAAIGAWCYRQKQQKSSMYEMNGNGQSHSSHGQQIEMQQKV